MDFSLWSAPLSDPVAIGDQGVTGGTRWSVPDAYTGGDIEPVPLPDSSVLQPGSYANTGKGTVVTVLGVQTGPRSPDGVADDACTGLRCACGCSRRCHGRDGVRPRSDGGPRSRDPERHDAQCAARDRRELPVQLAVLVTERGQPAVHERVQPRWQFRSLVQHRQREAVRTPEPPPSVSPMPPSTWTRRRPPRGSSH